MCYQGIARRLKRCSTAVCDKCRPAAMRTLIYNTRMAVCAAALDCYSKMSLCEIRGAESLSRASCVDRKLSEDTSKKFGSSRFSLVSFRR